MSEAGPTTTKKIIRTSRLISAAADRMTVHISPYKNGLAPETRDFITELNAEAAQDNTGVDCTSPWRTRSKSRATSWAQPKRQPGRLVPAASAGALAIPRARRGCCGKAIQQWRSACAKSPSANKSPDTFCTLHVYPFKESE